MDKYTDLAYYARQLCDILRDKPDLLDADAELSDSLDEVESILESLSED